MLRQNDDDISIEYEYKWLVLLDNIDFINS